MILFINTSQNDLIQIKLIDQNKIIRQQESHEQFKQAELILPLIDQVVSAKGGSASGRKKAKLEAVAVVSGPGAFSALRFGLTTANTLAWSLHLPLIDLTVNQAESDEELIKTLEKKFPPKADAPLAQKNIKAGDFKPVIPRYGHEPHITISIKK